MTPEPAKPARGVQSNLIFVALQVLVLILAFLINGSAHAATSITGVVQDSEGAPLAGVEVSLWLDREFMASCTTGSEGMFEIDVGADEVYTLYFIADDESTPGVDYLPARVEVMPSEVGEIVLTLDPAASLIMEGDIQFVESEDLPLSVMYAVINPISGDVLEWNGFPLIYGSDEVSQSNFIDREYNHLIVPSDKALDVEVNCTVLVGSDVIVRSFEVDELRQPVLEAGERVVLDVRLYSIPFNLGNVESLLDTVNSMLDEMGELGFYIAVERKVTTSATRLLSEARYLLEGGRYVDSFDACKKGYIELLQTRSRLTAMLGDASFSVYLIIVFLALASTTIAFLLSNRDAFKTLGSVAVYASGLVVLYVIYPGSVIVPRELYAVTAVIAITFSLIAAVILPRFLQARGRDGHMPVRNIVVPIFSIAKRNIRRRPLRFVLTLTSITVLVMSFVSLTSFSEGYGLVVTPVSRGAVPLEGVLLRAQGYTEMEPTYISQRDTVSGWLERQPESAVVSPKAESFPMTQPVVTLNGLTIWGVIGFDPSLETAITGITNALKGGRLPSEGGVMVSEALREALDLQLGDLVSLSGTQLTLEGIIDDDALRALKELEASSYLPGKLVNQNPEGEVPNFVLEPCEPSEVVILHLSTALRMPLVGVSRITITISEGADVASFAERLALERGYLAWSASAEGVHLARLSSYLEGKGLPLMVPWGIVVLNVVVTMLTSLYERRGEIHILSSVGLNPAQIAAIFVAEASIIGLTAGGMGYLSGLGLFKVMAILKLALEVRQKVSAFWSLASIGIAMTAVLMGALAALRRSVVITPSLMRRWRIEDRGKELFEPWDITLPIRLLPEQVDGFVDFMVRSLKALEGDPNRANRVTSSIKVIDLAEGVTRIDFIYKSTQVTAGNFYTKNTLLIEGGTTEDEMVMKLRSYGEKDWAHTTGSLVRMIAMRWSTLLRRQAANLP